MAGELLGEAAADPLGGAAVLRALLDASPLTDLLTPARADPALDLARLAAVLANAALCRAVAYRYLEEGLDRVAGYLVGPLFALLIATSPRPRASPCASSPTSTCA